MRTNQTDQALPLRCRWGFSLLVVLAAGLAGCEVDSFMDPSVVGRWEHTPVTLPILKRLDVIDEPPVTAMEVSGVEPADLVADRREYVIGAGDLLTVAIFELLQPEQESVLTRRVDETGRIRLPELEPRSVVVEGMTPSQLETHISDRLEAEGILRNATVTVTVHEARQRTFSVIGEPATGGTAIGTYAIPKPDFRLLDALAMARGVPGRTQRLMIYRQQSLVEAEDRRVTPERPARPIDPAELIERLFPGEASEAESTVNDDVRTPPDTPPDTDADDESAGGSDELGQSPWIYQEGRWVRRDGEGWDPMRVVSSDDDLEDMVSQRIIEIPYQDLLAGDMRYNIIIRPGDIIRVPAPTAGFVYIMGAINRPGTYSVPGENELTLKRLVASAGNLSQIAIPERVDLTRQVGDNMEATIRLNLRAIFEGTQPDIYLKPNDLVNVGTSFVATPLAIFRNGLRMTYGFGFVFDRNFATDVFD